MGKQEKTTEAAKADAAAFTELGSTGLQRWGGIVQEEFYPDLRGVRGQKILREMRDQHPVIGAMFFGIENSLATTTINVEAGGDEQQDDMARELVQTGLSDMSCTWQDTLSEMNTDFTFGWSWLEIVYKHREGDSRDPSRRSRYSDGLIGWRKWALRSQETLDRWEFDPDGGVQGMTQRLSEPGKLGTVTIPIDKSLHFVTQSHKRNPEGRPLLRNAYIPYYFQKRIMITEGIGIARDLAGFPVIYAPGNVLSAAASGDQLATQTAVKKLVTRIHRDEQEGAAIPSERDETGNLKYELKLLSSGGARQFDTNAIIGRYDVRIAMSVLMDFLFIGHEKSGSYAMHVDKNRLFALALGAYLDRKLEVINRHEIPRLLRLNGMQVKTPPKLTRGNIEAPDLEAIGTYLGNLAGAGIPLGGDPEIENHLRGLAKLPLNQATEAGKRAGATERAVYEILADLTETVRKMRPTRRRAKKAA